MPTDRVAAGGVSIYTVPVAREPAFHFYARRQEGRGDEGVIGFRGGQFCNVGLLLLLLSRHDVCFPEVIGELSCRWMMECRILALMR